MQCNIIAAKNGNMTNLMKHLTEQRKLLRLQLQEKLEHVTNEPEL